MDLIEAAILAIVQGLTEFLPISSSAHLILIPRFLGWADQGLPFDVAVHLGTLCAVIMYFRTQIKAVFGSWLNSLRRHEPADEDARLGWAVLIATIPAGLAGLFFHDFIDSALRSPMVIAFTTAVFGLLLWLVDRYRTGTTRSEYGMNLRTVLLIGLAQAFALIPGTSRSGITITAGLALGLSRQAAARFSFLLAIPVIALASALELWNLVQRPQPANWMAIGTGAVLAGFSAYLCIRGFLSVLDRIGMMPFAVYRIVLAGIIVIAFA